MFVLNFHRNIIMGSEMSEEERKESVEREVEKFKNCPDVTVNRAILMFCSTSSSDGLQQHLSDRKHRDVSAQRWMEKLSEKLSGLSLSPNMAGLGALALAIFIDSISASSSSSESTVDSLRRVFAEEKASEVWDQIDECLKRCMMHMEDAEELQSDMKRVETQLSAALTKLRSSMLRDDLMSSEALRAWVNGAAFHVQVLIHLVRLGGIRTCDPVERLLLAYLSELEPLFDKHKAAVEKRCKLRYDNLEDSPRPYFETEEGEAFYVTRFVGFDEYFEAYYEKHYSSQKKEITDYFRRVRDDLPALVSQVNQLSVD